jgi:hypothetical protein
MQLIKTCPCCGNNFESEGTPDTFSPEMMVLRAFIKEFHPFYSTEINNMTYTELTNIAKEITEEF